MSAALSREERSTGGGWWMRGLSNYDGHGVDLFESCQAPADDYDALPDIEAAAARHVRREARA